MSSKALIKKTEEHRDKFELLRDRILAASDDRNIISITDRIEILLEELVDALNEEDDDDESGDHDGEDD